MLRITRISTLLFLAAVTFAASCGRSTADDYPRSAKEIKQANPTAANGVYTIDPDGPGPNAPFAAYCDMVTDGGGWTMGLCSRTGQEAPTNDMTTNFGDPSPFTGDAYVRNVAPLAITAQAEIMFVVRTADGYVLYTKYTGMYHDPLPPSSAWTVVSGFMPYPLLNSNYGQPWSFCPALQTNWFTSGSADYGTAPANLANGLGQGPSNYNGTPISEFSIYVREKTAVAAPSVNYAVVAPQMTKPGDTVHVFVDATSDIAVASVTADDVVLSKIGSSTTWHGTLTAVATGGLRCVVVKVTDGNGQVTQRADADTTYRVIPVVYATGRSTLDEIMHVASPNFIFRLSGKVADGSAGGLAISDGSPLPVSVVGGGSVLRVGDFGCVTGLLDETTDPPTIFTRPADTNRLTQ